MSTVMTIGKRVNPDMIYDVKPSKRMTSFTVYALMSDINDLQNATYLDNREFYYVTLGGRNQGNIEMMVIDISGERFELVTRKMMLDKVNFIDTTCVIDAESFLALKSMSDLGFKHKYLKFPIPGTPEFWEVSVFIDINGHDHPWVRLELFTDDIANVGELPFTVKKFIVEGDPENLREDNDLIKDLWLNQYTRIDTSDIIKT